MELIGEHSFQLGENLTLKTKIYDNGDYNETSVFLNQQLTVQALADSAVLDLCGSVFGPEVLRKLANELDSALIKAKNNRPTKVH